MLIVNKISKNIKDKKILDSVSFNVEFGSICGLLGPNGAGKTSSFYIIAGLATSDEGLIQLAGEDISYYGGFGGKLICIFLDYLNKNNLEILPFYLFVKKTFMSQKYQKSQPIFSSTHNEFP